jgi:predicted nucleotide-binding protein
MAAETLDIRYEKFVKDAQELLNKAGLANSEQKPVIVGQAALDMFNCLASTYFPEDKQVGGIGPRGLIWSMYSSFDRKPFDPVGGARALAEVVKMIIKNRPPLEIETMDNGSELGSAVSGTFSAEPQEKEILAIGRASLQPNVCMNSIFIVHGRDDNTKNEVAQFLKDLGLNPVILHEQPNKGRTIIEKFEDHSSAAKYAVILLTPDDVGGLKSEPNKMYLRARQNVVFEMGHFIGSLGRDKVCALLGPEVEKPSDIEGILYIQLDQKDGWKPHLLRELKAAGLNVQQELGNNETEMHASSVKTTIPP